MSVDADLTGFARHWRACDNAILPGDRLPFLVGEARVGWVKPRLAKALAAFPAVSVGPDAVVLTDPSALPGIAEALSRAGHFRWRREAFDVRAQADGPVLATIDRGAIPSFGIQAAGVHLNGMVETADGLHIWIARRALDKALDPGKLDQIVAGGVPAGLSPAETLIKEAAEEAAIPELLARQAVQVGEVHYAMERSEGLRRDHLLVYDLVLPPDFAPHAADGEVESFELWPAARVIETVRTTNAFKFNVNLVLINLFVRRGLISAAEAER